MLTTVLIFLSVLAHAFSHNAVAIRHQIPIHGFTFSFIFFGVTHLEHEAKRPLIDFVVAVVGPLTSVLLALVFYVTVVCYPGSKFLVDGSNIYPLRF